MAPLTRGRFLRLALLDRWCRIQEQLFTQLINDGHSEIAVFGESLGGLFAMKALAQFDEVVAGGTVIHRFLR